jgi:succinate dehydrogenase flavin-adding protein (antitoxin of CptAB toxin-antitoxin module)
MLYESFVLTPFANSELTQFNEHKLENFSREQNNNDTGKDIFG